MEIPEELTELAFYNIIVEYGGYEPDESREIVDRLMLINDWEIPDHRDLIEDLCNRINSNSSSIKIIFNPYTLEFEIFRTNYSVYYIDGVKFDTLEEYIAIKKNDENFTYDELVKSLPQIITTNSGYTAKNPFIPKNLEDKFNSISPMSAKEAIDRYYENAEQRMIIFTLMSPAKIIQELEGELLDSQTIIKKREYTTLKSNEIVDENKHTSLDMYDIKEVEFPDTYELYRLKANILGIPSREARYIYIIMMKDTSTDRMYGLFADPNSEGVKQKDAILSIAETFQIPSTGGEMRTMTKEEYLNNLKSET